MKRRYIIAGLLSLGVAVIVIGLSALSAYVSAREAGWRENGVKLPAAAQTAVDLGRWWRAYGWIVGLAVVQLLLAAGIGWGVRRVLVRQAQAGEARDFAEGQAGSEQDGRAGPGGTSDPPPS